MAKTKSQFVCQICGNTSFKWMGKCNNCDGWNSYVEELLPTKVKAKVAPTSRRQKTSRPLPLRDITLTTESRVVTGVNEFDRVMGGGIMSGSFVLIAGDPGIGKSTLMTEIAKYLPNKKVLYVTGEESPRQVKIRAERLGVSSENLYLFSETNVERIIDAAQEIEPDILIVDSIQTTFRPDIQSAPGSVSQVRESAAALRWRW